MKEMISYVKGEKSFKQPGEVIETCHTWRSGPPNPDAQFMFFPVFTGQLTPKNNTFTFEGNCFEETTFQFVFDETKPETFEIIATLEKPRNLTCSDWYLIANTEISHVEEFFRRGTHKLTFKSGGQDAIADLKANGLMTYLFCESLKDELLSVMTTVKSFVGGLGMHGKIPLFQPAVPEYMEQLNIEWLSWSMNYTMDIRPIQKVEIDPNEIQSGDYFAIQRLDGLDPFVMYGSGAHSGHSVTALRFDGELYIIESQDAWYWPVHRIQRTLWKEWI